MKFRKIFYVLALGALTMNVFAAKTAEVSLKVTAPTYGFYSEIIITEDNAVANDFSSSNNGLAPASQAADWDVTMWAQNGANKYLAVENKSINGLKVCFQANNNEILYNMEFSGVTGEITLTGNDTSFVIDATKAYQFKCTAGALVEWTISVPQVYKRTVTAGQAGTICYPKAITAVTGGTLYNLTYATETAVYGEAATLPTVAGQAYVFIADAAATELVMTKTGDDATAPVATQGLVGTFVDTTVPAGAYGILNNYVVEIAEGNDLLANRAYINMEDLTGTGAPRRGAKLFGRNTPTSVAEVAAPAMKEGKMIINGQMVIVRDGKMFNAQGAAL